MVTLGALGETLASFKLGIPTERAMRLAQIHASGDGNVHYATYVRDLHAATRYDGSHESHHSGEYGWHHHAHHHSRGDEGDGAYHMSHELLKRFPREHPGRSAAAAAAAAVDHSLNPSFVPSDRPKIHELLS